MKNISDMNLAEVTLAILKAAVNVPDGMYSRAQFLAKQELRALLDAPAVERQEPADALSKGFYTTQSGGGNYSINIGFRTLAEMQSADKQMLDVLRSRSDVAALQSTIAQLEDKLNKAIDLDFQRRETIARLEGKVQELESGRGVVAAYRIQHQDGYWCTWGSGPVSEGDLQDVADGVISGIEFAYSSPPAPVAVVLPERADAFTGSHDAQQGWNACLDATAALNGERK